MSFTPQLHAQGQYTLQAPWTTAPNDTYSCIAIRSFADIVAAGEDVQATYYTPMGLTDGVTVGGSTWTWAAEVALAPNIITLQDPIGALIYVPDTFILSAPQLSIVPYSQVVLSASIGALPDFVDLTAVMAQIQTDVENMLGIPVTVAVNKAPAPVNPTYAQNIVLESARLAAITNNTTPAAVLAAVQAQLTAALAANATMTQILLANGIMPT